MYHQNLPASMNYGGGGGLSIQERDKLEQKLKSQKKKNFDLQLEVKRLQAEMKSRQQEQKTVFNQELQQIYGKVKSYEHSKKEYKRNLKNLKTFVQFCDSAMKRQTQSMNDGMQKLQSYGRRVEMLRRQVGVLQTALGKRNLVYRDLCTLYEVVFSTQPP